MHMNRQVSTGWSRDLRKQFYINNLFFWSLTIHLLLRYTHVSIKTIRNIRTPFDDLWKNNAIDW